MKIDLINIQVVIVDTPYDIWNNTLTKSIFIDMVGLKFRGYQKEYPYGVLPVDTADFVGTHLLLCEKTINGLKPIVTYRSITLERCKIHCLKFPMISMLEACHAHEHLSVIHEIIDKCSKNNLSLAYQSSWTIDPEIRKDRELVTKLRELMMAVVMFYSQTYGIKEIVGVGATHFKADRYFESWGFEGFSSNGKSLSTLRLPSFFDEEVKALHLTKFSESAIAAAEKWRPYWDARLTINKNLH